MSRERQIAFLLQLSVEDRKLIQQGFIKNVEDNFNEFKELKIPLSTIMIFFDPENMGVTFTVGGGESGEDFIEMQKFIKIYFNDIFMAHCSTVFDSDVYRDDEDCEACNPKGKGH